jgi:plasmid stability protein
MKNITITLDDETATWAKVYAARHNRSLSRFLGELLRTTMRETRDYEDAMQRYMARGPFPLTGEPAPYPTREDMHDRGLLR